jgi:hypothetical protein
MENVIEININLIITENKYTNAIAVWNFCFARNILYAKHLNLKS